MQAQGGGDYLMRCSASTGCAWVQGRGLTCKVVGRESIWGKHATGATRLLNERAETGLCEGIIQALEAFLEIRRHTETRGQPSRRHCYSVELANNGVERARAIAGVRILPDVRCLHGRHRLHEGERERRVRDDIGA